MLGKIKPHRTFSLDITNSMSLSKDVQNNLLYQHLWTDVTEFDLNLKSGDVLTLCNGVPPEKLHPDDDKVDVEYILPVKTENKWTISQWNDVFDSLGAKEGKAIRRIIMAMVTIDSTIVYYFINNGLIKPRKH